MIQSLFRTFARKFVYGAVGNVSAAILSGFLNHAPQGSQADIYLWNTVLVGAGTGLAAAVLRRLQWDPSKV